MRDAHSGICSVHVLTASTRRPIGIDPNISRVHFDLDVVVNHWIYAHRCKRRMAFGRAVKRADTHQPMHAAFGFHPTIGIESTDLVSGRFDASFLAGTLGLQFDFVAFFLGPADIHTCEHGSPVAGLCAACSGIDLKKGVIAISLAIQQRLKLFLGGG